MTINKTLNGEALTIALEGRLDTTTAPTLDDELVSYAKFLSNGERLIVEGISLVEIHHHAVFAQFQHLPQCGYFLPRNGDVVPRLEVVLLQFLVSQVADVAAPSGRAVDGGIMADHQYAVFRAFQVHFHDIDAHIDGRLYRRQGILRIPQADADDLPGSVRLS